MEQAGIGNRRDEQNQQADSQKTIKHKQSSGVRTLDLDIDITSHNVYFATLEYLLKMNIHTASARGVFFVSGI